MKDLKVKVWECKVIVSEDADLPMGFDSPPRMAAIKAIENAGIEVLGCASGWGGDLTDGEANAFLNVSGDVYYAGLVDAEPANKLVT